MRRSTSLYVAVALSGIAAVYVLNQWILPWWDARHTPPDDDDPPPAEAVTDPDPKPTTQTRDLPPLRTHSFPPPLPNGRAILTTNPDAMISSTSLHTLSSQDSVDESQSNTSDADTEPFVDVLSPPPADTISRRRSFRNHDLFASSHISFSELGTLVAPENEPQ